MDNVRLLGGRFPRIRGDVPVYEQHIDRILGFSPHTRGCSVSADSDNWWVAVFSAYAGMFRRGSNPCSFAGVFSPHTRGCSFPLLKRWKSSAGFPRIRGDVPSWCVRTRSGLPVFPAYAGMFQVSPSHTTQLTSFPRIRGDVPARAARNQLREMFSPHTRGCSGHELAGREGFRVFPAYAGMFLCADDRKSPS